MSTDTVKDTTWKRRELVDATIVDALREAGIPFDWLTATTMLVLSLESLRAYGIAREDVWDCVMRALEPPPGVDRWLLHFVDSDGDAGRLEADGAKQLAMLKRALRKQGRSCRVERIA